MKTTIVLDAGTFPALRPHVVLGTALLVVFAYFQGLTLTSYHHIQEVHITSTQQTTGVSGALRGYDYFDPIREWTGVYTGLTANFSSANEQYVVGTKDLEDDDLHGPSRIRPVPNPKSSPEEPELVTCKGPRGKRLGQSMADRVLRYSHHLNGFAAPALGSSSVVGFEKGVCYEREGRHGAYGLREDDGPEWHVKWDEVDWWQLQSDCVDDNKHRFDMSARTKLTLRTPESAPPHHVPRTAIVFRAHQHTNYTQEIKRNMRAVIQELALHTGGQYQVYLLVEIKDSKLPIWDDREVYDKAIRDFVPPEFWGITMLWTENNWYEKYDMIEHLYLGVHLGQWYPMQYFREFHPEFDFYWNWEMDARYTGHYHDLVQSVDTFSAKQPRKGLWERNARLYIPKIHGTYSQFRDHVQKRYQMGDTDTSIWGPLFPPDEPDDYQIDRLRQLNAMPPVSDPILDDFTWGVNEPADLVTFLPIFNPDSTKYIHQDAYKNYNPSLGSSGVSRRATIVTFTRLSSRLLQLMEAETSTPPMRHMGSEMWPHSVSMHYGLKAVSVPHGIYMQHDWPAQALDFVFNNGDQALTLHENQGLDSRGEGSGGPASTFGLLREHHWDGSTWYFRNELAPKLYSRWLGWEVDGVGGEKWEQENGRYCLPPMLLHPIKDMNDPPRERR